MRQYNNKRRLMAALMREALKTYDDESSLFAGLPDAAQLERDIFACRGRVGGVDVAFKSVDGRCKISSVGAAVEELVDRGFGR